MSDNATAPTKPDSDTTNTERSNTESSNTEPSNTASTSSKNKTFRLLLNHVYQDKPLLIKALLLLVLAVAADVTGPILAKIFIDDYLMPKNYDVSALVTLLVIYIVTQYVGIWIRYQQMLRFSTIALNAVKAIRQQAFEHVIRLPMQFFDKHLTGQLVSRITNDTEAIKNLYVQFLSVVLANSILLIGIIIAMAFLNVQLMLVSLILIPVVVCVIMLYQRLSGPPMAESQQHRSEINGSISESISGMAVIQAAAQQQRFTQEFEQYNHAYWAARRRTIKASAALLRPAIDLLSIVILVGVILVFDIQLQSGIAEIGVLYAFLSYLSRFTDPVAEITQRFNLYQQAMVAGDRVYELLHENVEKNSVTGAEISQGTITIEQLCFAYQANKPVLKNLDISVPAGEFHAIVGHTGSGKSTLLSLLLNFYQPSTGSLSIDNHPLHHLSQQALHQGIAIVPQEPFILAATIAENIDMGRNLNQSAIAAAAKAAGLSDYIDDLSDGYATLLGERGTRLSTGQRQQLVIARALAAKPKILLLDEATANVDSETEQAVQQALKALQGEVTMVVVAHRLSTIQQADKIWVLSHGQLAESGTHNELMTHHDGIYQSMYRLQQLAQTLET